MASASWRSILEQDSGIINVTLQNLGMIDGPIPWLTSPEVALISVILVNIWIGIPFNMTLLYSGLQAIPEELYEAGALDGATHWKAFRNITWPTLRPVVSVVLVLGCGLHAQGDRHHPGPHRAGRPTPPRPSPLQSYERSFVDFKFGEGAALSNILIVISLIFAIIYLRVNRRAADE